MQDLIISTLGDGKVSLGETAEQVRAGVIERTRLVTAIPEKPEEYQISVSALNDARAILKKVEDRRKVVKQPALDFGNATDKIAKDFCFPLVIEVQRLEKLIKPYELAELKRVEKEQEMAREEQERAEQKQCDALAEQERLANQKKPSVKKEIAAETKVQEAAAEVAQAQTRMVAPAPKVAGRSAKLEVMHEVTDAAALYKLKPHWFELVEKKSVIKAEITLDTKLAGLRVYEGVKSITR